MGHRRSRRRGRVEVLAESIFAGYVRPVRTVAEALDSRLEISEAFGNILALMLPLVVSVRSGSSVAGLALGSWCVESLTITRAKRAAIALRRLVLDVRSVMGRSDRVVSITTSFVRISPYGRLTTTARHA